jgi:hypothetical protein
VAELTSKLVGALWSAIFPRAGCFVITNCDPPNAPRSPAPQAAQTKASAQQSAELTAQLAAAQKAHSTAVHDAKEVRNALAVAEAAHTSAADDLRAQLAAAQAAAAEAGQQLADKTAAADQLQLALGDLQNAKVSATRALFACCALPLLLCDRRADAASRAHLQAALEERLLERTEEAARAEATAGQLQETTKAVQVGVAAQA